MTVDRSAVAILIVDLEQAESRDTLRQELGDSGYEHAVEGISSRFLAVWLGERGYLRVPLADEIDLFLLERLAIDLADGLGRLGLVPLGLTDGTMQGLQEEFDRACPVLPTLAAGSMPATGLRLRLVVDNSGPVSLDERSGAPAPLRPRTGGPPSDRRG